MKMILIDIPYGTQLALPSDVIHALLSACIVETAGYGMNQVITRTAHRIELYIVDGGTFQEAKPLPPSTVPPVAELSTECDLDVKALSASGPWPESELAARAKLAATESASPIQPATIENEITF